MHREVEKRFPNVEIGTVRGRIHVIEITRQRRQAETRDEHRFVEEILFRIPDHPNVPALLARLADLGHPEERNERGDPSPFQIPAIDESVELPRLLPA